MKRSNSSPNPKITLQKDEIFHSLKLRSILPFILMILGLSYVTYARYLMLPVALERDEGEFAYIAQLIIKGDNPFEAYNYKLPGTSLVYAFFFSILGESIHAIHTGLLVCNLLTCLMLFILTKKIFQNDLLGVFAAIFYGIASMDIGVQGMAAHATQCVNLFVIAGLIIIVDAHKSKSDWIFLSGISMGLSFLMKQPAIFFIILGGILIFLDSFFNKITLKKCIQKLFIYLTGSILPLFFVFVWAISEDSWNIFWKWNFTYPINYSGLNSLRDGIINLSESFLFVVKNLSPIWLLGFLGFILSLFSKNGRLISFLGLYFIFSCLALAQGLYFKNHYYVMILPVIIISAGFFIDFMSSKIAFLNKNLWMMFFFISIVSFTIWNQLETLFSKSPQEYTSHFYSGNPFNEAIILGDFIRQRTRPNEEIAVFGSEAEIYFYAQRKSATGYLFMYEIVKKHSYTELWRGELLDQISKNKPKMIVWVNNPLSWLPESEDLINPIINGLNKQIVNYHPVLIMDMINSTLTVIKQDDEVMDYKPQSDYFLMVFERNQ